MQVVPLKYSKILNISQYNITKYYNYHNYHFTQNQTEFTEWLNLLQDYSFLCQF